MGHAIPILAAENTGFIPNPASPGVKLFVEEASTGSLLA
jgi:hypothetical protein